jgi:hypothetical protein
MGLLDGVLGNKTLQNLALGNLKKFFNEDGAKAIVVTLDKETNEINIDVSKRPVAISEYDADNKKWLPATVYGATFKPKEEVSNGTDNDTE